ncbi:YcgL domain-containing protein [Dokdonella koreensis]|uniref:YcgL domain-containing protein I596_163 n=1 Tax=Dokdonella koreensis DS-123 TaxID=1300342 RepID=A0A167G6E7_9GAMM|nr:YcgL domain-containing protein [Dokdonella koreensis]ANB16203.1 YcgL domain-containing protein [Dokdonella koreensis DS-123]
MDCFVYKSVRKNDTYIFLRDEEGFDVLPAPLAEQLGELAFVIALQLSPERKLAREDVNVVMRNLHEQGFHLQLPLPDDSFMMGPS